MVDDVDDCLQHRGEDANATGKTNLRRAHRHSHRSEEDGKSRAGTRVHSRFLRRSERRRVIGSTKTMRWQDCGLTAKNGEPSGCSTIVGAMDEVTLLPGATE